MISNVNRRDSAGLTVPVQEGLAAEHRRELLAHALEHFLDAGVVADEGGARLGF